MTQAIDWEKACEDLASELASEVCRKFMNDEELDLRFTLHIKPGAVHGLLAQTPLHDKWDTVIVEYSVIPRREIVLDEERLRKIALRQMLDISAMECWQKYKKSLCFAQILREYAERAVGRELNAVFDRIAAANPGKYPVWQTHGHAVKPLHEISTRQVKGLRMPEESDRS